MHEYWQAVMISFGQELFGGCGFSLIPLEGLLAIISANPRLLLLTKSMVVYVRKQSRSAIFELQEKEKGWCLYAGEFPLGWEKKIKVVNLPIPLKKGLVSQTAKPKSAKRDDDSFKTCSDLVSYEGSLPPIGNIVLKSSPPPSFRTYSSRRSTVSKPKPSTPRPSVDAPPSSRTRGSKRKTSPPAPSDTAVRRSKHKEDISATRPILLDEPKFEVDPEPLSVYHPTSEEAPTTVSASMEGFFNRANVVAKAMASASATTAQEAPTKALVPPSEPVPAEESTHTRKVFSGRERWFFLGGHSIFNP
ncbi:uncharacterized protein LOC126726153 isoform X2 [Quercus robur]|uniref:uncharacterized protein LOC126726153 isoform X2 n=1 Tax=Quercus robur TaxID=38942 RepID=UPI0021637D22|nr:uncharacterized protein LOC126726153 isoform X2 [Quercus robur]